MSIEQSFISWTKASSVAGDNTVWGKPDSLESRIFCWKPLGGGGATLPVDDDTRSGNKGGGGWKPSIFN